MYTNYFLITPPPTNKVFLCNYLACPGTQFVEQATLISNSKIHLCPSSSASACLSSAEIKCMGHHALILNLSIPCP